MPMPRNGRWVAGRFPRSRPPIPPSLKQRVQAEADRLLADVLKPRSVQPPHPEYNYITDIFTRWFRTWFYFCATYTSPPRPPDGVQETFEVRFARLEYAGGERFHMAFMRYTGEWIEIYRDLSLEEALKTMEDDAYFSI
jgi:hypothetical protein